MNHICDYKALLTIEALDKFIKDESSPSIFDFTNSDFRKSTRTDAQDCEYDTSRGQDIADIAQDDIQDVETSQPVKPSDSEIVDNGLEDDTLQKSKKTKTRSKAKAKTTVAKKKSGKQEKTFDTFNQSDILIAVQNDNKFLNFIMSIRHISPNVFMYVEGTDYLVFIVNSADSYPVIIAKFQIEYPTIIQRNISDVWFSFPISTIANFITKTDKSSYQYSFILRNLESKMVLEYTSTLDNVMKSSENLSKVDKQTTLDIVFFNKIQIIKEFEEDIGVKNTDYISMIYNMPILLITECKDFGLIEKIKNLDRAEEYLEINDNSIVMNIFINSQVNKITIVNRSDKISGLVYWADSLGPMCLKMPNFTSLFKTTDRLKNKNEFCYYLLCKWKTYDKAETYMFIKIVTKIRFDKRIEPGITFGQLFNTGNLLYELFFCYHPTIEKQVADSFVDVGGKDMEVDMDFL